MLNKTRREAHGDEDGIEVRDGRGGADVPTKRRHIPNLIAGKVSQLIKHSPDEKKKVM